MPIYKIDGSKKDGLQKYHVRINYVDDNGKPKQLTRSAYGSEAAKELERQLTDKAKNQKNEMIASKMTIQELFDEYVIVKQCEVKETTLDRYRKDFDYYIASTFKNVRLDKLTINMVQNWKLLIDKRDLTIFTKRHAFSELRTLLNYAVKMEYIPKNPLSKISNFKDTSSVKKDMNFYTPQEFTSFIHAAKTMAIEKQEKYKTLSEWNYYVFFCIAFYTGLRKGEIHGLKWSDLDGSYLTIKRSIAQKLQGADRETSPKTKSSNRTLQIPSPLINVLAEHKKRMEQLDGFNDDYRICGIGTQCLRDTTIRRRGIMYAQMSKVKPIRIHDFRHSHVSVLANEGINIQEIARRLGHSKIEMTWNTYCHLYPREEEKAVEVLNGIE